MNIYLLVCKQSGLNNHYRVFRKKESALKLARAETKRLCAEFGCKKPDRETHGLAVIYIAGWDKGWDIASSFFSVEVYELQTLDSYVRQKEGTSDER